MLVGLLVIGLPVAAALGILGLVLSGAYSFMPLSLGMGELAWTSTATFLFLTVPLFILLGEILLRAGIADRMYSAVTQWVSWLPGGLMHSNVGACALFAATSRLERGDGGHHRHRGHAPAREVRLRQAACSSARWRPAGPWESSSRRRST